MQISDYYLLGDLHSTALVSKNLSIDWLCWPRMDSPTIFAKLLDSKRGSWNLANADDFNIDSEYLESTAIVRHKLTQTKGTKDSLTVDDFMPPAPHSNTDRHLLIRRILGASLDKAITLEFQISAKPDYDSEESFDSSNWQLLPEIHQLRLETKEGTLNLILPGNARIEHRQDGISIFTDVVPNKETFIILEYIETKNLPVSLPPRKSGNELFQQTIDFWHGWVAKGNYFESRKQQLIRSAITMKLLQYYPTGGIVASPTFGLPEEEGGERNWDYRYVWIRDATFTIYAFSILGYEEEASKFFDFIELILEKESKQGGDILPMYTIQGNIVPEEKILDNWQGYANSTPVRIGNGANRQLQLDVYGSLIDAYYFSYQKDLAKLRYKGGLIEFLVKKIEENWERKDKSIWEVRGEPQHFTYSKVMCWLGLDRALALSESVSLSNETIKKATVLRTEIYDWVWDNCYNKEHKVLTQSSNSKDVDATNFLYLLIHFLDRHDPQSAEIIDKTMEQLVHDDIYVYRYLNHHHDGLEGKEGAFLLCSFWLVSALAKLERVEEAKKLMQGIEQHLPNHYLMAEELDPSQAGKYLGNYPQAFSHLGYVMAVRNLEKYSPTKGFGST